MVAGTTGSTLNLAFGHTLKAGKRARSETAISRGSTSVSQASIVLAGEALGSLRDRSVAVVRGFHDAAWGDRLWTPGGSLAVDGGQPNPGKGARIGRNDAHSGRPQRVGDRAERS